MARGADVDTLLIGAGLLGLAYLYFSNTGTDATNSTPLGPLQTATEDVMSAISGWQSVNDGPAWVPYIESVAPQYGIPANLLSRVAYQESRFRPEIIRGTTASPAGALGIMQMMPAYFASVRVPVPFQDADVQAQIHEAAQQLQSLYNDLGDWSLALAGYNAGAGNVKKYGGIPPFPETQKYVAQITADVPVAVA